MEIKINICIILTVYENLSTADIYIYKYIYTLDYSLINHRLINLGLSVSLQKYQESSVGKWKCMVKLN